MCALFFYPNLCCWRFSVQFQMLLPNRITTEFLQYTEWLENKNLELTWSVLIVDPFLIPNSFSVPEEIWNKREKKSCITLLCRYRCCSSLLRSAPRNYSVCRPDILHQKQEVIKAMCKISLHSTPLPREKRQRENIHLAEVRKKCDISITF